MIKAPLQCGKVVPKKNRKMCFYGYNQPPPPQCTFLRNEGLINLIKENQWVFSGWLTSHDCLTGFETSCEQGALCS